MIGKLGIVVIASLVAALATPSAAAQPAWRAVDLGYLEGGAYPYAKDVNDRGQVVGACDTTGALEHAFLWDHGGMVDLWASPGSAWSGEWSVAEAINNRGDVVGAAQTSERNIHGFVWTDGDAIDLGTVGEGQTSWAYDINERGQVVGQSGGHAVLWEHGAVTDLQIPGVGSSAQGINNAGQIVGWFQPDAESRYRAFLWDNGQVRDLGSLGGDGANASEVSERGQVVGTSDTADGVDHPFLWDNGILLDLWVDKPQWSYASDVNDRGQVVGGGPGGAFIWERGAVTYLGGSLATGINERGQIVGSAGEGNVHKALLWTRNPAVP